MTVASTAVQYFSSTHSGANTLSGTAGTLIGVIDSCISGYGTVTLSSLAINTNIATATVSTDHGFIMTGGLVGPVITIAGANLSAINGNWRIDTIANSTTFTFITTGLSNQTVTGTITAKIAGLVGWQKAFSGTNLAAYNRTNADATTTYLRIDDSYAYYAIAIGYESMTGISSGTTPFPSGGASYWFKSNIADSTARNWVLMADNKRMLFFPAWSATNSWREPCLFGDLISNQTGDQFHCLFSGNQAGSSSMPGAYNGVFVPWPTTLAYLPCLPRNYAQTGTAINVKCIAPRTEGTEVIGKTTTTAGNNLIFPDPLSQALLLRGCIEFAETTSGALRGRWPGIYTTIQAPSLNDKDVVTGGSGGGSGSVITMAIGSSTGASSGEGRVFVDLLDWS